MTYELERKKLLASSIASVCFQWWSRDSATALKTPFLTGKMRWMQRSEQPWKPVVGGQVQAPRQRVENFLPETWILLPERQSLISTAPGSALPGSLCPLSSMGHLKQLPGCEELLLPSVWGPEVFLRLTWAFFLLGHTFPSKTSQVSLLFPSITFLVVYQ